MFRATIFPFFRSGLPRNRDAIGAVFFGFGADAKKRNIFEVIKEFPDLAIKGIKLRKFGQEVIRLTAGKKIHGTGSIPGGMNKNLSLEERDFLLKDIDNVIQWSEDALKVARDYTLSNSELVHDFGNFKSSYLSLVREDSAMDLYDGQLRCIDASGDVIFDRVDTQDFNDYLKESVKSWSYMKFPFIKERGQQDGWYRVGPLSRLNTCGFIDTPKANSASKEFKSLSGGEPNHASLAYHWARMIEVLHCAEKIKILLHDSDLQGTDLVVKGQRQEEGIGVLEAPRGTLFHHYKVDENDIVTFCNLIVSTTNNNEGMNRAVTQVAKKYISGQPKITEGMLNYLEVAVRAYDPCLSCATHAMGQMPLVVEMFDVEGKLVDSCSQYVTNI